ncbi:1-acyl-sn-glycerol-3-phosphate acyltransferase [Engelhardtia mirabilis]|uniref:2-acyl-glycerophospho-ethanolamine acyltransferase n=1 Tax=Engelhardtia mirabilis TaxID=2528011 RepID=A0A518BRE6_9BACT|nr:2-acyl-glycerophospho-ethanolamine acyltransferase [Planctomycetes bacterium Pla133]QDV03874.1 2-acyl-glycerophospho-ethanolamine acyltransferase [Planctomycetes bacterium Pla86]
MQRALRKFLLALVRLAVSTFYRVQILGGTVPAEGPVILVANHPNALVDPTLLLQSTERRIFFLGKEPLLRMPVIGWMIRTIGLIPVYRSQDGADTAKNADAFKAVFSALEQGQVIGLFPEGKSHHEPANQRLKTGAARMALGADPHVGGEPRIVPVGLVYAEKGTFRSRVAVWIGEPVDGGDLRAADGSTTWADVERLTERIGKSLDNVTVNLDQWEDWPLLRVAERIWRPARGSQRVQRMAMLAGAARRLRRDHPREAQRLARRIAAFRRALRGLGLSADHLDARYSPLTIARFALRHVLAIVVGAPLVGLAFAYWFAPYLSIATLLPRLKPGADLRATYKLVGALLFFPVWWIGTSVLLAWYTTWWVAVLLAIFAPIAGRLALRFAEDYLVAWREVRAFARIVPARRLRQRLVYERDLICAQIDELGGRLAGEAASTSDQSPALPSTRGR